MDAQDATRTLEVIRTLMERTCQYQFLTARAGLLAGPLATSVYAPAPVRRLGLAVLLLALPTLVLGPAAAVWAMGLVFGLGHVWLGGTLLAAERRQPLRLHRTVA